jgi:hypothetical protein
MIRQPGNPRMRRTYHHAIRPESWLGLRLGDRLKAGGLNRLDDKEE